MTTQMHSALERTAVTLIAVTLGLSLFATGVWAGSKEGDSGRSPAVRAPRSLWSYDPQTGNPMGPAGQLDFWNYDPETGAKIANHSPGVAPEDLAVLWSVDG